MRRLIAALVMIMCLLPVFSALGAEKIDMEHYLLIGVDEWGANEEGSARSDAIILASLDYGRDRMTFTSFARGSIVTPSYRKGVVKLNTVVHSAVANRRLSIICGSAQAIMTDINSPRDSAGSMALRRCIACAAGCWMMCLAYIGRICPSPRSLSWL